MVTRTDEVPPLPARPREAHKGTFGTVLVVAGSEGMLGAAILAARAALRGGAGLVRAVLPRPLMGLFTLAAPGATTLPRDGAAEAWLAGVAAVVLGPGLGRGEEVGRLVRDVLSAAPCPIVVDADALNALAPLRQPLRSPAPLVLTPHPGEAARLLGTTNQDVNRDREGCALRLAAASGQVVVLKGAGTVVTDGAHLFVGRTGNAGLATGGTGDVLAGLLGALLAQGLAPFAAARLAVHVHGAAGDLVAGRLSQAGLIAEDLPLAIAEILRP